MIKFLRNKSSKLVFLSAVCILVWLNSCEDKKVNIETDELKKFCLLGLSNYYQIDTAEWYLDSGFMKNYNKVFVGTTNYFKRNDGDTSWMHIFELEIQDEDTVYIPLELFKRFETNNYQYILCLGKHSDTLFYYKAELFGTLHKIFIQGEYYYQYRYNLLNYYERKFFESNKDSLIKVKGNNLNMLNLQ